MKTKLTVESEYNKSRKGEHAGINDRHILQDRKL